MIGYQSQPKKFPISIHINNHLRCFKKYGATSEGRLLIVIIIKVVFNPLKVIVTLISDSFFKSYAFERSTLLPLI